MYTPHWTNYIIIFFLLVSGVCLGIIGTRKYIRYGPIRGAMQELDNYDKKILKIAGVSLLLSGLGIVIRLFT